MARQKRLARPYSLFACPHGREGVPCDAVKNSQLLTTLLQHDDAGYSLAPEMPRHLLIVWAQASVAAQSKPLCRLKDAEWNLTDVIKEVPFAVLESLTDDQCLHVLRARSLRHILPALPQQYHHLAVLAHMPEIEASQSLCVPAMHPEASIHMVETLPNFSSITAITFNQLTLPEAATGIAFEQLECLHSLKRLSLTVHQVTFDTCFNLLETLSKLTTLQHLDMINCGLRGASMAMLMPSISKLTKLTQLNLSQNKLCAIGAICFSEQCSELLNLRVLNFSDAALCCCSERRGLDGRRVAAEPSGDGCGGPVADTMLWHMCRALKPLTALQHINLSGNIDTTSLKEYKKVNPQLLAEQTPQVTHMVIQDHASDESYTVESASIQQDPSSPTEVVVSSLQHFVTFAPNCVKEICLSVQQITKPRNSTLLPVEELTVASHITSLNLTLSASAWKSARFAKELSKTLPGLQNLNFQMQLSESDFSGDIPPCGDYKFPLLQRMSMFRGLTHLLWADLKPVQAEYVVQLSECLQQLTNLQDLAFALCVKGPHVGHPRCKPHQRSDADVLGSAFSALTGLTCLQIGFLSGALMKAVAQSLTARSLVKFSTDLPGHFRRIALMGDITWLGEFTARPPPLSQLRNLNIRSRLREGGQGAKDILKLATVLSPLQGLTKLFIGLCAHRPDFCTPRSNMLSRAMSRICQCMRSLTNLQSLSLQLDPGYTCMAEQLFQPSDGGRGPDPRWRSLVNFHVLWDVTSAKQPALENGDILCRSLVACEYLEFLQFNFLDVSAASLKLLHLRSSFPNLRSLDLELSMSQASAQSLGVALCDVDFPALGYLSIDVRAEDTGRAQDNSEASVARHLSAEAMLRSVLAGFCERPLPSLTDLKVTAVDTSKAKFAELRSMKQEQPALGEEMAQHSVDFAESLSRMLQTSLLLNSIHIESCDMTPHAVQRLAQCVGDLKHLTRLSLGWAELGPQGAAALCQNASGHSALLTLKLRSCIIEDDAAYALHAWIQSLPELHKAAFVDSEFGPMGYQFMEGLKQARALRMGCSVLLLGCAQKAELRSKSPNSAREAMEASARCTVTSSLVARGLNPVKAAKTDSASLMHEVNSTRAEAECAAPAAAPAPEPELPLLCMDRLHEVVCVLRSYSFSRFLNSLWLICEILRVTCPWILCVWAVCVGAMMRLGIPFHLMCLTLCCGFTFAAVVSDVMWGPVEYDPATYRQTLRAFLSEIL